MAESTIPRLNLAFSDHQIRSAVGCFFSSLFILADEIHRSNRLLRPLDRSDSVYVHHVTGGSNHLRRPLGASYSPLCSIIAWNSSSSWNMAHWRSSSAWQRRASMGFSEASGSQSWMRASNSSSGYQSRMMASPFVLYRRKFVELSFVAMFPHLLLTGYALHVVLDFCRIHSCHKWAPYW